MFQIGDMVALNYIYEDGTTPEDEIGIIEKVLDGHLDGNYSVLWLESGLSSKEFEPMLRSYQLCPTKSET